MKRFLILALVIAALGAFAVTPAFAMDACDHGMAHANTVEGLRMHVEHAYDMGHIDSAGVRNALTAQLDQAAAALERGRVDQALNVLNAFVRSVSAQAGKHIEADCAAHLVMHAGHVIQNL